MTMNKEGESKTHEDLWNEIFAALALLEKERGIPQSFMMDKIIQALTTAYKRDHEGVETT